MNLFKVVIDCAHKLYIAYTSDKKLINKKIICIKKIASIYNCRLSYYITQTHSHAFLDLYTRMLRQRSNIIRTTVRF